MRENKKTIIIVFVAPIVVLVLSTAIYMLFISDFRGYDSTSTRFIHSLDFYENSSPGSTFFIGDSQIREDINCNIIDSLHGVAANYSPCFNLGIEGMSSLQYALIQKKIIDAGPKHVIIGVSPLFFSEGINSNKNLFFFMGERRIMPDATLNSLLNSDEKKSLTMNSYLRALYKRRFILPFYESVIRSTLGKRSGQSLPDKNSADDAYFSSTSSGVYSEFKSSFLYTNAQTEEELQKKLDSPELLSPFNNSNNRERESFDYLISNLYNSSIILTVVSMPLNPLLVEILNEQSLSEYKSFLYHICTKNQIECIDLTSSFSQDQFIDLTHLNAEGRNSLSKYFFEKLITIEENFSALTSSPSTFPTLIPRFSESADNPVLNSTQDYILEIIETIK